MLSKLKTADLKPDFLAKPRAVWPGLFAVARHQNAEARTHHPRNQHQATYTQDKNERKHCFAKSSDVPKNPLLYCIKLRFMLMHACVLTRACI